MYGMGWSRSILILFVMISACNRTGKKEPASSAKTTVKKANIVPKKVSPSPVRRKRDKKKALVKTPIAPGHIFEDAGQLFWILPEDRFPLLRTDENEGWVPIYPFSSVGQRFYVGEKIIGVDLRGVPKEKWSISFKKIPAEIRYFFLEGR